MSINKKIGWPFLCIGSSLLAGGLVWGYSSIQFAAKAVQVTGNVIELVQHSCTSKTGSVSRRSTCYEPVVEYKIENQTHRTAGLMRSNLKYQIGETFDLIVDPKSPQEARTSFGLWFGPILLVILGGVFTSIGGFLLRSHFLRKKLKAELQRSGVRLRAPVLEVGFNKNITVNGRHPYKIIAQFSSSSSPVPILVKSEELWYDPIAAGQIGEDQTVDVIYDPQDPQRCIIDLKEAVSIKTA